MQTLTANIEADVWERGTFGGRIPSDLLRPIMGKELFHLTEDRSTMIVKFTLPDALDAMEFDRLNDSLVKVLDGKASGNWLLDLTDVSYMGSAVLGLMVNIRQQVKSAKGRLVLCGMSS